MNSGILWVWIAALGVSAWAIAIGMIGKSLLEALARNPQVWGTAMVYAILAMAFAEATAIYAFVIAFMLVGKIGSWE